jgi:hypothetical protein
MASKTVPNYASVAVPVSAPARRKSPCSQEHDNDERSDFRRKQEWPTAPILQSD